MTIAERSAERECREKGSKRGPALPAKPAYKVTINRHI